MMVDVHKNIQNTHALNVQDRTGAVQLGSPRLEFTEQAPQGVQGLLQVALATRQRRNW